MKKKVAILGTGMGGLGARHRLRGEAVESVLYDKASHYGGHTASFSHGEGFVFDRGPHVSFTKDERIQDLLAANVDGAYETIQYQVNNYWQDRWLTHPVQNHMHGLPADLVTKIVAEFARNETVPEPQIRNYADWLLHSYGRTFAETFPMVYTRKYHTTGAENMTTEWIGPRMYQPNLEEVIRGALSAAAPNVHYVTHFRYPTHGGFMTYLKSFVEGAELALDHKVTGIVPDSRALCFANGATASYDALVSSIPLPDLVPMIEGAPREIRDAAVKLACSSVVLVNIGVAQPDVSQAHISYFYDSDYVFTRLSFPHKMSPNNVPPGCSSIQAEVYFSGKYRPLTGRPDDYIEPVIRDLVRCGLIESADKVVYKGAELCDYANVIFDLDRPAALATVHGYLDDIGVRYCGRYGDWGYMWTDESFKSGERAAESALSDL